MPASTSSDFLDKVVVRIVSHCSDTISDEAAFFQHICEDADFMKALFHAHPTVYRKALQWMEGKLTDGQKVQRLHKTLYHYYTRMCNDPTPFGYFSSVGTAEWAPQTSIRLSGFSGRIKLDTEVLATIVAELNKMTAVRRSVKHYVNNTIYHTGAQFRYIEMTVSGDKASYKLSAVEYSEFLELLLNEARGGTTIRELAARLAGDYSEEELVEFIEELVAAQLLIPELQVNATGPDPLERVVNMINELTAQDSSLAAVAGRLHAIQAIIGLLNTPGQDIIELHGQLAGLLEKWQIPFDERNLLQADNFSQLETATVSADIKEALYDAIKAVSCFEQDDSKIFLENFRKKFSEKYEDAWVPLLEAIDTESGISFGYFMFQDDSNLTSGLELIKTSASYVTRNADTDAMRLLLFKKYFDACQRNEHTVRLEAKDFKEAKSKLGRLAATYQAIFSIIDTKTNLIALKTSGNATGGGLLTRFNHGSKGITGMLHEIADYEQKVFPDAVVAEIVHIPSHRIGNITFRPLFRKYEIPVLTMSTASPDAQIPLSDILIAVKNGRIILWSKRLGKRVIPMLTNAHNYNSNTSPVYQFLCELVYQDIIPTLYLNKGDLPMLHPYIRRIQYENVIISPAAWNFSKEMLQELLDMEDKPDKNVIDAFRTRWQLPQRTTYARKGRHLLIDWDSSLSVYYFLQAMRNDNNDGVYMEEYLFNEDQAAVKDKAGRSYLSEFIAVIKNSEFPIQGPGYYPVGDEAKVPHKFFPGDEWVYLKLYTGIRSSNKILANELQALLEQLYTEKIIRKFFFIRYNDPEYHLRLRFLADKNDTGRIISLLRAALAGYTDDRFIWKLQADTYVRELERYGPDTMELSESVFEADSLAVIRMLPLLAENYAGLAPLFFMAGVDSLLTAIGFSLEKKYALLVNRRKSYEDEFRVMKNESLRLGIVQKEKEYRKQLDAWLTRSAMLNDSLIDSFYEILNDREKKLQDIVEAQKDLLQQEWVLENLASSWIHMYAIRLFQANPRENELVGYYILHAYYYKCIRKQEKISV